MKHIREDTLIGRFAAEWHRLFRHCLDYCLMTDREIPAGPPGAAAFATTRWSMVLAAGQRAAPDAEAALAGLCEVYWVPLYEFARRRGYSAADAADATQSFFARLIEKDYLQSADPERGRFRAFLLTAFKRFLSHQRSHDHALKRGGGKQLLSLDHESVESQLNIEPADHRTPERLYERRWAIILLDRVLQLLEEEYLRKGRVDFFFLCRGSLTGLGIDDRYASIAATFDMTESAVKVAVHRMKIRYRELLRAEVAQTVANDADVDDELRMLMQAVSDY